MDAVRKPAGVFTIFPRGQQDISDACPAEVNIIIGSNPTINNQIGPTTMNKIAINLPWFTT